jgi:hypothetical protein
MALAPSRKDNAPDLHIRASCQGHNSSAQRVVAVGHPDCGPCLALDRQWQDSMPRRAAAKAAAKPRWDWPANQSRKQPSRRLLAFVLERNLQLRAIGDCASFVEMDVLLDDLGDPQIAEGLCRRFDRGRCSVLPRVGARSYQFGYPIHTHQSSPLQPSSNRLSLESAHWTLLSSARSRHWTPDS